MLLGTCLEAIKKLDLYPHLAFLLELQVNYRVSGTPNC